MEENRREGLSVRIGRTFTIILRRALLIVCVESVLLSGIMAVLYTLKENESSVVEYTEEMDRTMQSKVSMLDAVASGISSGTIQEKEDG